LCACAVLAPLALANRQNFNTYNMDDYRKITDFGLDSLVYANMKKINVVNTTTTTTTTTTII